MHSNYHQTIKYQIDQDDHIAYINQAWLETEEAVIALKIFDQSVLPGITHGICPP